MNFSNLKDKEMLEQILFSKVMSKNSSLLFSIEQWELTRRLKNSGLSKEQLCQAFDDLDRMERDLGALYNIPLNNNTNTNSTNTNNLYNLNNNNNQNNNNQYLKLSTHNSNNNHHLNSSDSLNNNLTSSSNAANIVNAHFATIIDPEIENKEIDQFRIKGEVAIHSEISFFVYKHDLKQSQIARMAGVNQAYVSKFLRGEFFDLSENGKTLIYKWYLRFNKNPTIYLQAHNITLTQSNNSNDPSKLAKFEQANLPYHSSFTNVTNVTYDTPKRTRFSFKPEHLVILEKCFIENQYPDQKKREELARLCNEARPCTEREKVTEQIITHWFQNKRKITRKTTSDDSSKSPSLGLNGNQNTSPLDYNDLLDDNDLNGFNNSQAKSNDDDDDQDDEQNDELY